MEHEGQIAGDLFLNLIRFSFNIILGIYYLNLINDAFSLWLSVSPSGQSPLCHGPTSLSDSGILLLPSLSKCFVLVKIDDKFAGCSWAERGWWCNTENSIRQCCLHNARPLVKMDLFVHLFEKFQMYSKHLNFSLIIFYLTTRLNLAHMAHSFIIIREVLILTLSIFIAL